MCARAGAERESKATPSICLYDFLLNQLDQSSVELIQIPTILREIKDFSSQSFLSDTL